MNNKLSDKIPIHDLESEKLTISAMIQSPWASEQACKELREGDFYNTTYQKMFRTLNRLVINGKKTDAHSIKRIFRKDSIQFSDVDYMELVQSATSGAVIHEYAKIVKQNAFRRQAEFVSIQLQKAANDPTATPKELSALVDSLACELGDRFHTTAVNRIGQFLQKFYEENVKVRNGEKIVHRYIKTPYKELSYMLGGGFTNGEMIIVAARPSVGKTTFVLNIVRKMAVEKNIPALFFSLEMSGETVSEKILAAHLQLPTTPIHRRYDNFNRTSDIDKSIDLSKQDFENLQIYIDDASGLSFVEFKSKVRQYVKKHNIQIVFVDYLQLMTPDKQQNRNLEVGALARNIKKLAGELKIPIVILSQLKRPDNRMKPHRPKLSDLRDSGEIEQHADVVLMLHREDYENDEAKSNIFNNRETYPLEVICRKNRNGGLGTLKLNYNKVQSRIEEGDDQ